MANERVQRLLRRNEKITHRFLELSNKKYQDRAKLYSNEAILVMLADEFHLSTTTIEKIVFGRVQYKGAEDHK